VGAPPESDREAILGFDSLHRVAQSYLGPLWIVADTRDGRGTLRLLRRLALPDGTTGEACDELARLGRQATELVHPNVLRVLEVIEQGGALAFVYEHSEAEPLRSLQSWANLRGLSFPVGVALRISVDLLQGLSALHELETRDPDLCASGGLSPDSVLVSRDGLTQLGDPLIASGAALLEGIGFNTAKLAYAAPEQVRPAKQPSSRADLFTCAAMLWELLASRRLLAGSRPAIERKLLAHDLPGLKSSSRAPSEVSDELIALVERALAADPAQRPASALEFAEQLGECGHALASRTDVAAFVGKLSGPRFDRRTAAIRSRSSGAMALEDSKLPSSVTNPLPDPAVSTRREPASDVETPRTAAGSLDTPASPPSVPRPAPSAPDAASVPIGQRSAPFPPTPSSLQLRAKEGRGRAPSVPRADAVTPREPAPSPLQGAAATSSFAPAPVEPPRLGFAPSDEGRPALWDQMVAPAAPVTRPPTIPPLESNTLEGFGIAKPALPPNRPLSDLAPPELRPGAGVDELGPISAPLAPPASVPISVEPAAEPATADPFGVAALHAAAAPPEGPPPFAHLLSRSKRASAVPKSLAPEAQSWFALQNRSLAADPAPAGGIPLSYKLALGLIAATAIVAGTWSWLGSRREPALAAVAEPPATSATPAPAALAEPPPTEPPPAEPRANEPAEPSANAPASIKAPEGASREASVSNEPKPAADAPPPAGAADFASPKLDDSQLVVLFALEGRGPVPSCEERLGDGKSKFTGKDMRRSMQQAKAAKRALDRGEIEAAHELACGAVAHHPKNALAQRTLADAALELGDPARAKAAVDLALALSPKDKSLMALSGDVLVQMGDIAGGRAMWLRTTPPKGGKAARTKRLVAAYRKAGDKELAGSNWSEAATYFRRVVVLTNGSFAPSLGLSEALLGLDRSRAGLVWAERAAQAFPKDSRIQVLFGDALYENGQGEKARAAWKTALDVQPNNRVAARRLRDGKP